MGNLRKKKYSSGEGAQFMTRRAALKKLQLSLKDFRKLCILKGIYPREPRNRKRAQKGDTGIKTLYHKKDIQFLLHEPIIWELREYKIFSKKVGRARALRDFRSMKRYLNNHPTLKLDHIVKERYPTFIDALRDLDDCLTLCFLFSTFPSLSHVPRDQSALCRRLTVEFMHAVIEAKALRKVFISIKGYYYQAEIKGVTINWIVPHHFAFQPQTKDDCDFRIMSTFVEFYTVMLGFVNFRLYHELNIIYPPKFNNMMNPANIEKQLVDEKIFVSERVAALNFPLSKTMVDKSAEEDVDIDTFPTDGDAEKLEQVKIEAEKMKQLKNLFKGLKFFINREVPREPLVFLIRCFGGEVSWDKLMYVGATFDETDESITHQIVDRPKMGKQFISRYYIQPQWIFDSVNARKLLPVNKYFMGVTLPPHLSPFIDPEKDERYVPPEEKSLVENTENEEEENMEEDSEENDSNDENVEEKELSNDPIENNVDKKQPKDLKKVLKMNAKNKESKNITDNSEDKISEILKKKPLTEEEREKLRQLMLKKMTVTAGEIYKENPWEQNRQEKQEYRLREKMVQRKHRKLYKSMMEGRKQRAKEAWLLKKKRRLHDEQKTAEKKIKKKKTVS